MNNFTSSSKAVAKSSKKAAKRRSDSFELSDSEQQSPLNLKGIIFELQTFFPKEAAELSEVDNWIKESKLIFESQQNDDDEDEFHTIPLYNQSFIANIRKDMRCVEVLKNIRSLLEDVGKDDEITNWDVLVKAGFKVQYYHTFVYTLMRLLEINTDDKINRDLAFNAGRTYFSLLGLPGSKRCFIWEEELVLAYFKLFSYHDKMRNSSKLSDYSDHYMEIQIIQMLNECRNVFNVVCIVSDQDDVLEKYIETLSLTLESFMSSTKNSSHDVIMKCYENLEALCLNPLPDNEIEGIMYLIFCRTVDLHFVTQKRNNRATMNAKHGESISDFFLYLLSNYSDKTKNTLQKFIKSLLSNPEHKFERERYLKLFEVAVKYEQAIFWSCGESIIDYLEKLALAADHRQRLNGVEFCGKMLLINSTQDLKEQSSAIDIPRETFVIKILFEKIYDKQDNVKLKSLTALKAAIINGNDYCKKIFSIIFKSKATSDNPEIVQILGEEARRFQMNLLSLLQTSTSTYIRKASLEILCKFFTHLLI